MSTGISPTSSRQPFASGLPDTPPDTAHRADPAPPPQAEPANSPSRTLRDMARHNPYPGSGNSNGAAPTSAQPTQSTPLTPAQQAARQHNQALWQRLDPADQAQVRYQIERNFGPHALQDGIVRLEGKTIVTRAEYQKVKQDSHSKNPRIAQSARQQLASLVAIRSFNYGAAPDASARMGADIAARINAAHGTQIDFNELARYEGGQALSGYQPWWPTLTRISQDGAIHIEERSTFINGRNMLKGANASGVTIGTGVDLGQQDPAEYSKRLKAFGAQQTLIDKLEPYMGLTRGQAAEYLREHPLTVTKQEADLLDEEMKSYHLADTIAEYNSITEATKDRKEFSKLSSQEQTILFSRHYQDGNISNKTTPSKEIAVSLSKGNVEAALKKLNTSNYRSSAHKDRIPREHDYLQRWFQTIDTEAPKTKPAAAEKATP